MSNLLPFSVIIPAAGNSGRMGSDKALLKLADGKTFAENLLSNYTKSGADPVIMVVNKSFDLSKITPGSAVIVVNDYITYGCSY